MVYGDMTKKSNTNHHTSYAPSTGAYDDSLIERSFQSADDLQQLDRRFLVAMNDPHPPVRHMIKSHPRPRRQMRPRWNRRYHFGSTLRSTL